MDTNRCHSIQFFFGIVLIVGCLDLIGQNIHTQAYRFKSITVNDNLSHSNVNAIVQDSLGYIWIGTNNGLNRFDGYQIKTFKHDVQDVLSPPGNRVKAMLVDRFGHIWISFENKGLYSFDPTTLLFEKISLPHPKQAISRILLDEQGDIWVNKPKLGLYRLILDQEGSLKTVQDYSTEMIFGQQEGKEIRGLFSSSSGLYFFTNQNEIWDFDRENDFFRPIYKREELKLGEGEFIRSFYKDGESFWLGTDFRLLSAKAFERGLQIESVQIYSSAVYVTNIYKDQFERLWCSTSIGLFMLDHQDRDKANPSVIRYYKNKEDPLGILSNRIFCFLEDRFGVFWLGSHSGVNYTNLRRKAFVHIGPYLGGTDLFKENHVGAIFKNNDGKIWIGTNSGLYIYPSKKRSSSDYLAQTKPLYPIQSNVNFIFQDSKDAIWLGIDQGRIGQAKENNGKLDLKIWEGGDPEHHPPSGQVKGMCEDHLGRLWVTTRSNGLFVISEDRQSHFHLSHDPNNINSLSTNNLTVPYYDPLDSCVWVSSRDGGLTKISLYPNDFLQFQHFRYDPDDSTSISSNHTWQVLRSKNGQLWVGTLGGGLNELIEEEDNTVRFRRYITKDGLLDNDIECIAEDDAGNLWLAGIGLTKFNPAEGSFVHFDYQDGLQSNHFYVGAVHKDPQGLLYFGGVSGINIFDPASIRADSILPQVYITGIRVNNEEVEVGKAFNGRVLLENPLSQPTAIQLTAEETDIFFDFVGLQYASPQENLYEYRLKGLNDQWVRTEFPNLSANYSNIPPGDYTFQVRASNGDGVWNESVNSLPVYIAIPWFQSPLAFLVYIIIISLALYLFQKVTKIQAGLKNELIMAEKEQELNQAKLSFFTQLSHELRTPLTLIKGPLDELLLETNVKRATQFKLEVIQKSTNRLLRLINQLLDFRKMESSNMSLKVADGDIVKFIREVFIIFSQSSGDKHIDFRFKSTKERINLTFDRDKMEIVLMNLLSNAFKFTQEGNISVSISAKGSEFEAGTFDQHGQLVDNYLLLEIKDSGVGIPKEEVDKIFNPYYQVKNSSSLHAIGTGIGLSLVSGIVRLHKGNIEAESTIGQGSVFTLKLPFGNQHFSGNQLIPNFKNSEYIGHYVEAKQERVDPFPQRDAYLSQLEERSKKFRVLIVEDNPDLRSYLERSLKKHFYVLLAVNGQEGYKLALEENPDLIVSDIMMPVLDGISMLQRIKSNELISHIPIILLTARTSTVFEQKGLITGAEDYISKPFDLKLLISKIYSFLKNRERLMEFYRKQIFFEPVKENQLSPEEKLTHRSIQVVEAHLDDPEFNVQKLAQILSHSQSSLYRKIKQITDKSLVEFIRDIRLRKAAQLLNEDELSITQIAYAVGFNDVKYFRKHFKRLYQLNPSEFREKSKKKLV
ncbi:MAG: two-component regulator propeller domain-containing protein [Bacteroidota bacterium]